MPGSPGLVVVMLSSSIGTLSREENFVLGKVDAPMARSWFCPAIGCGDFSVVFVWLAAVMVLIV